ncbi:MAG: hypothetical protein AMXMBFR36_04110 [Acidobacteriota bacterium]
MSPVVQSTLDADGAIALEAGVSLCFIHLLSESERGVKRFVTGDFVVAHEIDSPLTR